MAYIFSDPPYFFTTNILPVYQINVKPPAISGFGGMFLKVSQAQRRIPTSRISIDRRELPDAR
jgi:hypothetical protein